MGVVIGSRVSTRGLGLLCQGKANAVRRNGPLGGGGWWRTQGADAASSVKRSITCFFVATPFWGSRVLPAWFSGRRRCPCSVRLPWGSPGGRCRLLERKPSPAEVRLLSWRPPAPVLQLARVGCGRRRRPARCPARHVWGGAGGVHERGIRDALQPGPCLTWPAGGRAPTWHEDVRQVGWLLRRSWGRRGCGTHRWGPRLRIS